MKKTVLLAAASLAPVLAISPIASTSASAKSSSCTYPPQKTHLTLSVSQSSVAPGTKVEAFGELYEASCVVSDSKVHIYNNGTLTKKKAVTDSNGEYSVNLHPYHDKSLKAVFDGNNVADPGVSATVTITVKKK